MAHTWWHPAWVPPYGGGPQSGEEEYYDQPGQPDVMAAMEWARTQAEQEGREPGWKDILSYWTTQDPSATPAGAAQMHQERQLGEDILPEYGPEMEEEVFAPPEHVAENIIASQGKKEKKKTRSDLEKLFLYDLMANMRGGDIGQAPAVVTGGPQRPFPTMMRQFAPWEREKPYWWIR